MPNTPRPSTPQLVPRLLACVLFAPVAVLAQGETLVPQAPVPPLTTLNSEPPSAGGPFSTNPAPATNAPLIPESGAEPTQTPPLFIPVDPSLPVATPTPVPAATPVPTPPPTIFAPSELAMPEPVSTPTQAPPPATTTASDGTRTTTNRARTAPAQEETPVARLLRQGRYSEVAGMARDSSDAKLATALGWAYFNDKTYASASDWFEQALEWNENSEDAAYGLALTKFRQGNLQQAEAIARWKTSNPKMKALLGDISARRSVQSYQSRNYQRTLNQLDTSSRYRRLNRQEQIVRAWSLYNTGQVAEAAQLFAELYRAKPDKQTAEGVYVSYQRLGATGELMAVASQLSGPLYDMVIAEEAQRYYKAGLFLAANYYAPQAFPVLQNIDTPIVQLGGGYMQKSGQTGESRLSITRIPDLYARFYPAPLHEVSVRLAQIVLNAGRLGEGANVGTAPAPPAFAPFTHTPITSASNLWEFNIGWSFKDWLSPYAEIGSTPLNGPLAPWLTGRVGLAYNMSIGYLQGEFYSKSIKESITSYIGSQDPYSSRQWGRVTETGGALAAFVGLPYDFTLYARGFYGVIKGTATLDNQHYGGVLAAAKVFKPEGFEFITLGPAFSAEGYQNNQNYFTYGYGGYFSPEYIVQAVLALNFLTKEGEFYLLGGGVSAGVQHNKQVGGRVQPFNPSDNRYYETTTSTTGIFAFNLGGGFLINNNWMMGANLGYQVTADYNEGYANLYIRYLFGPRYGLFRTDLTPN